MKASAQAVHSIHTTARTAPACAPILRRKCACGGNPGPSGECAECRQKRLGTLQRAALNNAPTTAIPSVVNEVVASAGLPLDLTTRAFMEPRFGHDFSQVRVHTDRKAVQSAHAVNALAYTVGNNIVFGARQYSPHSPDGQHLLAHELTHVVQQAGSTQSVPNRIEPANSSTENEAERVATRVLKHGEQQNPDAGPEKIKRVSLGVSRTPIFGAGCTSEYDRCRIIEPLKAANQLLDRVLAELPPLANGSVTQGRIVDLLNVHFHDPSNVAGRATIVLANFQAIKAELNANIRYICSPPAADCAQAHTGAFTGDQPRDDIGLCPTYFQVDCAEQARMLIHEICHHIPATRIDRAYVHQPNYMSLTAAQATENPDTYAQFSKMVFLGTPSCKECSSEIQLRPGQY